MNRGIKMDIKRKMALWYVLLAATTAGILGLFLFSGARRIAVSYYEHTLRTTAAMAQGEVEYENGELEIDDDLKDIPDVHISLYTSNGTLIYGRARFSSPFKDGELKEERVGEERWYLLDTRLCFDWRGDVWMRCAKRADAQDALVTSVLRLSFILLPLLILLTGIGGFIIARHGLQPVKRMACAAEEIISGGDLHKRVGIGSDRKDEMGLLSATLDAMLERLEQAFQRERQFTSDAAHELRTPLNALRLLCEEALARTDTREKDALIGEALERTDALGNLVAQLLALSRMEAGGTAVHKMNTDVSALLKQVAEELEPVASDAQIVLRTRIDEGIYLNCDEALIRRLAVNLVSNAIRYGKRGGYAQICLTKKEEHVLLGICDDGIGIAPEDIEHIWERFWRAEASRHSQGTGLGLAIAHSIIAQHGASASVKSELGVGTEIWVRF